MKLKPCPFCGGKPIIISQEHGPRGFAIMAYSVECLTPDCFASNQSPGYKTREFAAEEWNKRYEPNGLITMSETKSKDRW